MLQGIATREVKGHPIPRNKKANLSTWVEIPNLLPIKKFLDSPLLRE